MEIKPVIKNHKPKYPDIYGAGINKMLLEYRPVKWKGVPLAGIIISAAIALSLSGCYVTAGTMPIPTGFESGESLKAPVFEHGQGIGIFKVTEGEGSEAKTIFLSEEEAFDIIYQEFIEKGRRIIKSGREYENLELPVVNNAYSKDQSISAEPEAGSFSFDFVTYEGGILIEYITHDEYAEYISGQKIPAADVSTAGTSGLETGEIYENYIDLSKALNENLNNSGEINPLTAVFYDPAEIMEEDGSSAKEIAKDQLRQQVRDFIQWLEIQGGF